MSDFLTIKDDGSIGIELAKPMDLDGADVGELTMREPTVEDQLSIDKIKGGEAEKEMHLFANLCEVTPQDLRKLTLRDYRKVQEAFRSFLD